MNNTHIRWKKKKSLSSTLKRRKTKITTLPTLNAFYCSAEEKRKIFHRNLLEWLKFVFFYKIARPNRRLLEFVFVFLLLHKQAVCELSIYFKENKRELLKKLNTSLVFCVWLFSCEDKLSFFSIQSTMMTSNIDNSAIGLVAIETIFRVNWAKNVAQNYAA